MSTYETVDFFSDPSLIEDPYGYFDTPVTFPSSGEVRTAWSYPRGPEIHSRTVQITIR